MIAIDAGGTMTDAFVVDARGEFAIGKAQTVPDEEARSFLDATADALEYWNTSPAEALPRLEGGVYSGTSMLNRLLSRKGRRVGVLVTKGCEDSLRMGRAAQTHLNLSFADRLHVVTHAHHEPLVPRRDIRGVPERVDVFGRVAIPLYEDEARAAIGELLDDGVEALVVNFLHSYRNPIHERAVKELADELVGEQGLAVPVLISSDYYPVVRDLPRLNTIVIEAYAAEPSRVQLAAVQECLRRNGADVELRIVASHGGTISIESRHLARTLCSGPIGGVIGARYLARKLGLENVIATDVGGTSFDLAAITAGELHFQPHPSLAHFLLAIPMVDLNSVGAGTGSFVRIDPTYGRITIGPDSAGAAIGVCWPGGGVEEVTVTDCALVTGRVNPDYFLGGRVQLDPERAEASVRDQIAGPLGIDVQRAAAGVLQILEMDLRGHTEALVQSKGYTPAQYALLSYGGGGPLHVAGYTDSAGFADVIVPSWAAAFSAFGCAAADYEYRHDATVHAVVGAGASREEKLAVAALLNDVWRALRARVGDEFRKSGIDEDRVEYQPLARIQYAGQLNDLEVPADVDEFQTPDDVDRLLERFEAAYAHVYAESARSPDMVHAIVGAVIRGTTETVKPELPIEPVGRPQPETGLKGTRTVFWTERWVDSQLFEMDEVVPGQAVRGPAIVEAPSTTFAVPPGFVATLDEHRLFHLRGVDGHA